LRAMLKHLGTSAHRCVISGASIFRKPGGL
jgi:hypothetical protein